VRFIGWILRACGLVVVGALVLVGGGVSQGGVLPGEEVDPPFELINLGSPPGVPPDLGGITFLTADSSTILIGGDAGDANAAIYSVMVSRNTEGHIVGFSGTAELFAQSPYIDGGLVYGPGDVLFYSRYQPSTAEIGEIKPGSTTTDRVVNLDGFGVAEAPGGLNFVPPGFPGAGKLKMTSYEDGAWWELGLTPDNNGTYDVISADHLETVREGSDGFVFVPRGMPGLEDYSVLINNYDGDAIHLYEIDSNGDPIPLTEVDFARGLNGPLGAAFDSVTGDLLISEYGSDEVLAIRGFSAAKGDVNCDGVIDARDVALLLSFVADIPVTLAPGCARINSP